MKKSIYLIGLVLLASCGTSYDKTPEDWADDICNCSSEKGIDAQECFDKIDELKNYYEEADYEMHDKATTLVGECAPELLMNHMDQ